MRIDRIEIAKREINCKLCFNLIRKGELKIVGFTNEKGYREEKSYCLTCAKNLNIDILDKKRINNQLANIN